MHGLSARGWGLGAEGIRGVSLYHRYDGGDWVWGDGSILTYKNWVTGLPVCARVHALRLN